MVQRRSEEAQQIAALLSSARTSLGMSFRS
jgi:hypothetical protein